MTFIPALYIKYCIAITFTYYFIYPCDFLYFVEFSTALLFGIVFGGILGVTLIIILLVFILNYLQTRGIHIYLIIIWFSYKLLKLSNYDFYPTALKDCQGIVFTHGVWMGERAPGRVGGQREKVCPGCISDTW